MKDTLNTIENSATEQPLYYRYSVLAFVIGCLFPCMAWITDLYTNNLVFSFQNILKIHQVNKIHLLVDLLPIIAFTTVFMIQNYITKLEQAVSHQEKNIEKVRTFAEQIGNGQLDVEYESIHRNDDLGLALTKMRDNLRNSDKTERERQWTIGGVAKLGEILRTNTELAELGYQVVVFLEEKINAVQGAFYVLEEDAGSDKKAIIRMIASHAYNRKKYLRKEFKIGEGLVGQAAIERDLIYRTEIPESFATITSGLLGDKKPHSLLIVPLISNDILYGVIELASLNRMTSLEIDFVKGVGEVIGQTIFNLQVNEKTNKLLNEVNKSQKRMQGLLENASEIITIYEENKNIRYISPSVERILGYAPDEMIGINDTQYIHRKGAESFNKMFSELLANPLKTEQIQFSYKRKDGEKIWMEATGKNLLEDPAIQGIVVNMRDITMKLKAEREEKKSGQMQALSENSLDLIMRVDTKGIFFYINPVIEKFTGNNPDFFLQKDIYSVQLEEGFVIILTKMVEQVVEKKKKISFETTYKTPQGKMILNVNIMPEFNGEQVETLLIVAHDITEAKLIEQEIQEKNQKITESINYAERIQRAILTNEQSIYKAFPDSFILFKPRDLVSGDFPWTFQKGDDIYVAVVDCTGHGVPGALMSLIGHFILNECVNSDTIDSPGTLLDKLHKGINRTLKQEENEESRDGMDVAICKINMKTNELQYAGAHRPLIHIRNGQLTEIKGDKYPIGGVQYKNRNPFTNHTLNIEFGDSIYFYSDGFPDQIGGPAKKKFMSEKIKNILLDNDQKDIKEIYNTLGSSFDEWKGGNKQIDDVLMIGIRFLEKNLLAKKDKK
jgi:PAS domain S-box-containing protein